MLTPVHIVLCGNQYLLRPVSFFGLYSFKIWQLGMQNICQISMADPNGCKTEELSLNDSFMTFDSFQNKHIYSNNNNNKNITISSKIRCDFYWLRDWKNYKYERIHNERGDRKETSAVVYPIHDPKVNLTSPRLNAWQGLSSRLPQPRAGGAACVHAELASSQPLLLVRTVLCAPNTITCIF